MAKFGPTSDQNDGSIWKKWKMEIHKDMSSQNGKSNLIYCCIQAPIPRICGIPSRLKKAMTHIYSHWICPKGNKYNINCYNQSSRSEIFMIRFSEDDPEDPFELEFLKTF